MRISKNNEGRKEKELRDKGDDAFFALKTNILSQPIL